MDEKRHSLNTEEALHKMSQLLGKGEGLRTSGCDVSRKSDSTVSLCVHFLHEFKKPVMSCIRALIAAAERLHPKNTFSDPVMHAGLHIDENTAKFYLADAGGDLKKAIKLFGTLCIL